jgi:hypothetical protein
MDFSTYGSRPVPRQWEMEAYVAAVDRTALEILNHMKSVDIEPDTTSYLCLLQCFLAADDGPQAQEWLLENVAEMEESCIVSYVTRLVTWNSANGDDSLKLLQTL